MKPRTTLRGKSRHAFTLVELLINVAIIPIISTALFVMIARLHTSGDQLQMRMNASEELQSATRRWRTDIALSASAELGDAGTSMSLSRPESGDTTFAIQYALNDRGELERRTLAPSSGEGIERDRTEIIARGITEIEFRAAGSGFALKLVARTHDGTRPFVWEHETFATPLAPAPAPVEARERGAAN